MFNEFFMTLNGKKVHITINKAKLYSSQTVKNGGADNALPSKNRANGLQMLVVTKLRHHDC